MTIYHYHPVTKEFLGSGEADVSPLEHDVYLIPAHAVTTAPPAAQEGKFRKWNGAAWVYEDLPDPDPVPEPPTAIQLAKAHVATAFDALDLLTMKDWKDTLPADATPKLQACYAWVQEVIAAARDGSTEFEAAPHTFADVLEEIGGL